MLQVCWATVCAVLVQAVYSTCICICICIRMCVFFMLCVCLYVSYTYTVRIYVVHINCCWSSVFGVA